MTMSPTVELIWNLAAQLAMAGEFGQIEPEHIFAAILKVGEVPVAEVEKHLPPTVPAKVITDEIVVLQRELAQRGLDPGPAFIRMMETLGRGTTPPTGAMIHRTDETRLLFEAAAVRAGNEGRESYTTLDLLNVLLGAPTRRMLAALGDGRDGREGRDERLRNSRTRPDSIAPLPPLLQQHGRDLVREAMEGRLAAQSERQAQAKALLAALGRQPRKSVLLISDDAAVVGAVVATAACNVAGRRCPDELKWARIVDVSGLGARSPEELGALEAMVREAGPAGAIVVLPALASRREQSDAALWMQKLAELFRLGTAQCICRVPPALYEIQLAKDPMWKGNAEAMWIAAEPAAGVPDEL